MNNYTNPNELLEALKQLEELWLSGGYEECNVLHAEVQAQWPGFQVRRSNALKKYGLFPMATEEEAMEADQADLGKIDREWRAYRNEGLGKGG
jgi:hypothetical protein